MNELLKKLNAKLDETELIALGWPEQNRSWQHVGGRKLTYNNGASELVEAIDTTGRSGNWWEQIYVKTSDPDLVGHIVHNDPKRVLRRVVRDRKLLARHVSMQTSGGDCCQDCSWLSLGIYEIWPCPDVRDLAEEYGIEVKDADD